MTNKKLGNNFEREFCDILFRRGFWVHNLAQNAFGQPADVIAVRNGTAYLIDCKVCINNKFPLSRMESNQRTAMGFWKECGNGCGWFALQLSDKRIYMFPYKKMLVIEKSQSSIEEDTILRRGIPLERWLKLCG